MLTQVAIDRVLDRLKVGAEREVIPKGQSSGRQIRAWGWFFSVHSPHPHATLVLTEADGCLERKEKCALFVFGKGHEGDDGATDRRGEH